jgi:hypothetical protein
MKKQQSKRIDDALDKALTPPKRRPSPMLDGILSQYTSVPQEPLRLADSPPVEAPAQHTAPAQSADHPRHDAGEEQHTAPAQPAGVARIAGYTKVANDLLDRLLPTLDVYDQSVIIRLWRLSRGFGSEICRVAQPTLAKSCNISERQLRITLVRLEARGLIKRVERDFDNKNMHLRGTVFRILLEDPSPARRTTPAQYAAPVLHAAPEQHADIKENTYKETHNTGVQQNESVGVRAGSRFSLKECRRYAEHLQKTGQGITNAGGYATIIHRTGEADDLLEEFIKSRPDIKAVSIDTSKCPDCHGTNFREPGGVGKGVVKCKHERLVISKS